MHVALEPEPVRDDVIDFDLPCVKCGYNLRTQHPGSVCPECEHRVLASIDEHLRRRMSRFDLTRFRDRPAASLRSIRAGAWYALAANTIMLAVIFMPEWMYRRRSPERTVLLVAVCVALTSAAMSIWRFAVRSRADRPLGVGPWLLRAGAVGAVAYPVFVTLRNDTETFSFTAVRWIFQTEFPFVMVVAAWTLLLGVAGRLVYAQWWLRLEGFWLLGWPLLLCALPFEFFFAFFAPFEIRNFYWGRFVSLAFFTEIPLATGFWPLAVKEMVDWVPRYNYRRMSSPEFPMAIAGLGLQGLVFVCDATLAWLTGRELRRRRTFESAAAIDSPS